MPTVHAKTTITRQRAVAVAAALYFSKSMKLVEITAISEKMFLGYLRHIYERSGLIQILSTDKSDMLI